MPTTDWREIAKDADQGAAETLWGRYDDDATWARINHMRDSLRLYNGSRLQGLLGMYEPATFNVIQSIVDTIAAHTLRNRVRPMFLTEGGNWEAQRKATGCEKAVRGIFTQTGMYGRLGQHICWDGYTFGTAGVKVTADFRNRCVKHDRVMAHHVRVSTDETMWHPPRSMAHVFAVDRGVAMELYGHDDAARDAIELANPADRMLLDDFGFDALVDPRGTDTISDMIEVMEVWHLPSTNVDPDERAKTDWRDVDHDGFRFIMIRGHMLDVQAWGHDRFPIAFFTPHPHRRGFWGRGVPEQLVSIQLQLDRYSRRISEILQHHARPMLYVNRLARVNTAQASNGIARIWEGNGAGAIQLLAPPSVPADLIAQRNKLSQEAYEQFGMSQLTAYGQKPAGIEHAPGLQLVLDTESVGHTQAFKGWEQVHIDTAHLDVIALRALAEQDPDMSVIFRDDKELEEIRWQDVDLKEERHTIGVWPTNLLPVTPTAKRNEVGRLMEMGLITPEEAFDMLDMPDIEAAKGDRLASKKNIESKLQHAIDGRFEEAVPHAHLNLELALSMGRDRINALESSGADRDIVERVIQWTNDVQELITRAMAEQAQAQQGMAPPPGPGGAPGAPPPPPPEAAGPPPPGAPA